MTKGELKNYCRFKFRHPFARLKKVKHLGVGVSYYMVDFKGNKLADITEYNVMSF